VLTFSTPLRHPLPVSPPSTNHDHNMPFAVAAPLGFDGV
jgi:hypothetical protein